MVEEIFVYCCCGLVECNIPSNGYWNYDFI